MISLLSVTCCKSKRKAVSQLGLRLGCGCTLSCTRPPAQLLKRKTSTTFKTTIEHSARVIAFHKFHFICQTTTSGILCTSARPEYGGLLLCFWESCLWILVCVPASHHVLQDWTGLMLISKELAILRKSGIMQTEKPNSLTNELWNREEKMLYFSVKLSANVQRVQDHGHDSMKYGPLPQARKQATKICTESFRRRNICIAQTVRSATRLLYCLSNFHTFYTFYPSSLSLSIWLYTYISYIYIYIYICFICVYPLVSSYIFWYHPYSVGSLSSFSSFFLYHYHLLPSDSDLTWKWFSKKKMIWHGHRKGDVLRAPKS